MRRLLGIAVFCAVAVSAAAVPAKRGAIIRTMEDGTEKTVYLHGNAFSHYMTDAEGNWLDEMTLEPMSEEAKAERMEHNRARMQARRVQQKEMVGNKPNIAPRGLVILVNFANKKFVTPYDTINNMLNGDNYTRNYSFSYKNDYNREITEHIISSGSAHQYFHDQSYGQYNPVFDVVGPYTLEQNYSYYGSNVGGDDAHAGQMIKEACELADKDGADFTKYDNNNDGRVDFVYVLYAGYGEADGGPANTVWPHNYDLGYYGNISCTVDGKKVRNYACSNEINYINNEHNGIGTFCHEFSHVLGLPDLYETNQNPKGVHTLFEWDILDYGPYNNDGNTPPSYSAYERFFCGWLTPRVLKEPEAVWLNPINFKNGESLLICQGDQHNLVGYDPNPKVFYLLESRVKEGWDQFLPGKGMLITKISYDASTWEYNTVNNSADKMGVDIIEAKTNNSSYSKASDAFPGGAKYWYGFDNHEIEQIAIQTGGAVTFSYRGAAQGIEDVQSDQVQSTKIIKDGQLYLMYKGTMYNVQGLKISDL